MWKYVDKKKEKNRTRTYERMSKNKEIWIKMGKDYRPTTMPLYLSKGYYFKMNMGHSEKEKNKEKMREWSIR